jgi:hypothetical protein
MADLWRDIQYAARTLRKAPGFAALAILTLALGIGANSALFSVINAVLLRPLPYREADRLVFLTEWSEQVPEMSFSVANFKDLRDQSRVFESLVASNGTSFILTGAGGEPERLNARRVSSGFFATLGKQPILGRAFTPEEDKPGAEPVVLLSEGFWERRFGRDPNVVGRSLSLSGESFTGGGASRAVPPVLEGHGRVHPPPAPRRPDRWRREAGQPSRHLRGRTAEGRGLGGAGPDRGEGPGREARPGASPIERSAEHDRGDAGGRPGG